jgi:copper(I)-binding protein
MMINRAKRTLLALALATLAVGPAVGRDQRAGDLSIGDLTLTPTRGQVMVNAGYVAIANRGAQPDRLVSATSARFDRIEIHTHVQENGMMRMRPLPEGLAIPANGRVVLQRGGLHLMLFGAKSPLQPGEQVEVALSFERAGVVTVRGTVAQPNATAASGHQH